MAFSWQGVSGRWYEFDVARSKRAWEATGGIYMFVKPGDLPTFEAGGPVALFVAATDSFADSLARHDMWGAAQALGAAEIHLLPVADPAKRAQIEQDVLRAHTPILNRRSPGAAATTAVSATAPVRTLTPIAEAAASRNTPVVPVSPFRGFSEPDAGRTASM